MILPASALNRRTPVLYAQQRKIPTYYNYAWIRRCAFTGVIRTENSGSGWEWQAIYSGRKRLKINILEGFQTIKKFSEICKKKC